MSIGIIGKKLGMTQIFNEQGQQIPVTVIEAEPNPVVQVTTSELGAPGVQLGGNGTQRLAKDEGRTPRGRRAPRAAVGHAKKAGLDAPPSVLRGFSLAPSKSGKKTEQKTDYKVGDLVKVDIFQPGELVRVTGTTKGRGFQGVVKRYGFGGGANTHGNTKHREPGAVSAGTDPSRIIKGKRMPGHYGAERHTQINLRVERVDTEKNLLYVRGAVAGPENGIVVVRKSD